MEITSNITSIKIGAPLSQLITSSSIHRSITKDYSLIYDGEIDFILPNCEKINLQNHKDISKVYESSRAKKIIVDMTNVNDIDSVGCGALVKLHSDGIMACKEIIFSSISPNLMAIIRMLNLHRALTIYETTDDAINSWMNFDEESLDAEYVSLGLFGKDIKIVSITKDGKYKFIGEKEKMHDIMYIISSKTLSLKEAIEELEYLVNNEQTKEKDIHEFFERNPEFIINDEYRKAHSHIVLARDDDNPLIPDFLLEPAGNNALCDILEIKLPNVPVYINKKNRLRYSAVVHEAIAQIRTYGSYFDEKDYRSFVQKKYGLSSYKPKMFVIIGKKQKIDPVEERNIQTGVNDVYVRTYDDIINRMKSKVSIEKGR